MSVTAIVPTYNRAEYLCTSLDSILGQTVAPDTVIVVDDGSTDDTAVIVASYAGRVTYLRQDNAGKASAINHALAHATGDAIWIFDDDDVAENNAVATLVDALAAAPDADFAFGMNDMFKVDADGSHRYRNAVPGRFESDDLFCALLERCFIFQGGLLVRRRLYDAAGPFAADLARAQDYEMLLRLARIGTGVHVPKILFHQRDHEGERGIAQDRISGTEIWERQKTFDATVLTRTYNTVALGDYLPLAERRDQLDPADTIRALLRRGAAMARKKLWDLAAKDFTAAAQCAKRHDVASAAPREAAMLRRVFDEFGYARDHLDLSNPLLQRLAALPAGSFRASLVAALTWPLFRYSINGAVRGDIRNFLKFVRLYVAFAEPLSFARHGAHLVANMRR